MSVSVGYKQSLIYMNKKPEIKTEIYDLSAIVESRRDNSKEVITSVQEFMKKPIKYCFNVSVKADTEKTAFRHSYYFDNKEEATKEHKKLKVKLYDQLTEPFLKKLNTQQTLSMQDQLKLNLIFDKLDRLR